MRTKRQLPGRMLPLLMAVALLGGCVQEKMDGSQPLPEGKYPVEFTSTAYGLNVNARAVTEDNTWEGGEEVAIKVGDQTKKYVVTDKTGGKITATAPFYWTKSDETKTVTAWHVPGNYNSVFPSTFQVAASQSTPPSYQSNDLVMACQDISFGDASKQLAFKHLTAKVVVNLKGNAAAGDVSGATVRFVSTATTSEVKASSSTDRSGMYITPVKLSSSHNSPILPYTLPTAANGFMKSMQALMIPQSTDGGVAFIEVTHNGKQYNYKPTPGECNMMSGNQYTYNITVKAAGIDVQLAESGEWTGSDENVSSNSLKMSFKIDLTNFSTNTTYILPFRTSGSTGDYTLVVDWGDGASESFGSGTSLSGGISHNYSLAKEYEITISTTQKDFTKAQIPGFSPGSNQTTSNNKLKFKSLLTPLLNTGEYTLSQCFSGCTNLTGSIPEGLFAHNAQVRSFASCFSGCTNLTGSIPVGLFANNTQVTSFNSCFSGCSKLESIPEKLFANNPQATDFNYCFGKCTSLTAIPEKLFANNPQVTNFGSCFNDCTNLTSIPGQLFANNEKVKTISNCFEGCTKIASIPEELFAKNIAVTTFYYCFYGCTSLTSIPEALFANNTAVTDFSSCFYNCGSLKIIPPALFTNNIAATNFSNCFYGCTSLASIPEALFANNTAVTSFSGCFQACTSLTSIPEILFANNKLVKDFSSCFSTCSGLTSIPPALFANNKAVTSFESCFSTCRGLTSIPATLFVNNTAVTFFGGCFNGCSGLTSIPEKLFANHTAATDFSYCFRYCYKLVLHSNIFCDEQTEANTRFAGKSVTFNNCFEKVGSSVKDDAGTAPELWRYAGTLTGPKCFSNIGTVSNAISIPSEWK